MINPEKGCFLKYPFSLEEISYPLPTKLLDILRIIFYI
jgi:hypothetical protein